MAKLLSKGTGIINFAKHVIAVISVDLKTLLQDGYLYLYFMANINSERLLAKSIFRNN